MDGENTAPNVTPENGETGAGEAPATAPEGAEAPATPEGTPEGEAPAGEGEAAGDGDSQPQA